MTTLITKTRIGNKSADPQSAARIALLGCGNVGSEVARAILGSRRSAQRTSGRPLTLGAVLVRDPSRGRGLDHAAITADFGQVLASEPDVIVESIGGIEPAYGYVKRALERGISVVTANKSLVARRGAELREIAHRSGAILAHEAAVGAAVPAIASLHNLRGDVVTSIDAIINGTCNFILARMAESRCSFDQALRHAIDLGLAEPDPAADICGIDSAEKLCILASEIGIDIQPDDIDVRGIGDIAASDLEAARRRRLTIKFVAQLAVVKGDVHARVCPALLPRSHWLTQPTGAQNCIVIRAAHAGTLTLLGEGAGAKPTASAIIGDVIRVLGAHGARPIDRATRAAVRQPSRTVKRESWFVRLRRDRTAATAEGTVTAIQRQGLHVAEVEVRHDLIELLIDDADGASLKSVERELGGGAISFAAPLVNVNNESGHSKGAAA